MTRTLEYVAKNGNLKNIKWLFKGDFHVITEYMKDHLKLEIRKYGMVFGKRIYPSQYTYTNAEEKWGFGYDEVVIRRDFHIMKWHLHMQQKKSI
jgi:hypothetical protein